LEAGSASEMTYIVSRGALNSTHSLTLAPPKLPVAARNFSQRDVIGRPASSYL